MNFPATLMISALLGGALPQAFAAEFEDFARVVSVRPLVEQVKRPHQECRTEYVQMQTPSARQERGSSGGGAILGGIVGAVAGNQIGGGNGRNAAIAAGAIIGTLAGDRAESNSAQANAAPPTYSEQAVRQCRTVDAWESRTTGYEVTYDYRGRNYTGFMSQDPGPRVRLRVSVDPISQ